MAQTLTREAWIAEAAAEFSEWIREAYGSAPKARVSVGLPGGRRTQNVVGQCWYSAEDSIPQVFVSPVQSDPDQVLFTLLHELIHAATPGHGHRGDFASVMHTLGVTGKLATTSVQMSDALKARMAALKARLGAYDHSALRTSTTLGSAPKGENPGEGGGTEAPTRPSHKQGTRMLKCICATDGCEALGYTVRTTAKWLTAFGAPVCPGCQTAMMQAL